MEFEKATKSGTRVSRGFYFNGTTYYVIDRSRMARYTDDNRMYAEFLTLAFQGDTTHHNSEAATFEYGQV